MSRITHNDLPRIFATLRYAGELGEAHGQLLWQLSKDWGPGINAASLEGNISHSDVSDPTGLAAMHGLGPDLAAELAATIARLEADSCKLRNWITSMVTTERPPNPEEEWCRNHLRVDLHEPRHRGDLCRRCDEIRRDTRFKGAVPSPALLAHWHTHARTPDSVVVECMEAEVDQRARVRSIDTNIRQARPRRSA